MTSMHRIAVLAIVVLASVACGTESNDPAATTAATGGSQAAGFTGDGDGHYCDIAAAWAAHELSRPADGSPGYSAYWDKYLAFVRDAATAAPDAIAEDWDLYEDEVVNRLTPVLRKYDFDQARAEAQATAEEKAILSGPSPQLEAAQGSVLTFESQVCGSGQPPAADEAFGGDKESEYCKKAGKIDREFQSAAADGFSVPSVRTFFTSETVSKGRGETAKVAPDEIKPDVEALVDWARMKQVPAVERFGYDIRKLLTEGEADDRHAFNASAPDIRGSHSRVIAYEEQVCGI